MSILKKLFGNSKTEIQKPENLSFDVLVAKARNSGNIEDLNILYSSLFEIKDWNYIVSKNCTIEEPKPFIGVIDEKPWLFVFTDRSKADQYARTIGHFHENNGSTLILTMNLDNSLNMIHQLNERGVYGVRFNDGENGWFTDILGLFNIKNYLENK